LTPWPKASSGYGGVIPVKQGLVVDFYRMKRILRADAEAQTAAVEAGEIWEAPAFAFGSLVKNPPGRVLEAGFLMPTYKM